MKHPSLGSNLAHKFLIKVIKVRETINSYLALKMRVSPILKASDVESLQSCALVLCAIRTTCIMATSKVLRVFLLPL